MLFSRDTVSDFFARLRPVATRGGDYVTLDRASTVKALRALRCAVGQHNWTPWRPTRTECFSGTVVERAARQCRNCTSSQVRSIAIPLATPRRPLPPIEVGTQLPRRREAMDRALAITAPRDVVRTGVASWR